MPGFRNKISLIFILVSLFAAEAFSQQTDTGMKLTEDKPGAVLYKPRLHYSIGTSFLVAPRFGSVSEVTFAPALTVPLSPKLSVEGGIMASYFYAAPFNTDITGFPSGSFNGLYVYGSAIYQLSPQFTLYGSAIKEIAGNSPFNSIARSSYSIGTQYNFGNFSIGVTFQMSDRNNIYSPFQSNSQQGFYSPFNHGWGSR
jgi:hypothetical protein